MLKKSLYLSLLLSVIVAGLYSCAKKVNTINNGQVVETPFSLFFTDSAGAMYNSTDGKTITKTIFPPDGNPARCIVTGGENLVAFKLFSYVNYNNAQNFNTAYHLAANYQHTDCNGRIMGLDQTMAISTSWDRIYVPSIDLSGLNYLGIAQNSVSAPIDTFFLDYYYDTDLIVPINIHLYTFAQQTNGTLAALNINNDLYFKTDPNARWKVTPTGTIVSPLPSNGFYSIGHLNNQLIAIDDAGYNGAYHSDDMGVNWKPYPGLPANRPLLSIYTAFEQLCFVGTDSAGLYVLNQGTNSFQPVTSGLSPNTVVRGITAKQVIYKNGTTQHYVFLATNQGIFQSSDMGNNWIKTIPGNFAAIY